MTSIKEKGGFNFIKIRYLRSIRYGVMLLLVVFVTPLFSQDSTYFDKNIEQHSVNEKKWERALSKVTYEAQREKEREEQPKERTEKEKKEQLNFESNFGAIFKIILILIAVVLIGYLIIKFMNAENIFSPGNKKIKGKSEEINIDKIEENLYESDLDKYIRGALGKDDYTMAIRLYYLAILKKLSLSNQIKWKKDKTNGEYVREMDGKPSFKEFREVTQLFDRVWYGKLEINKKVFENISPKFKAQAKEN